jgi:dopachrome tautomerase
VIDLNTDKILKRYEIPSHVTRDGLGLASITIDVIDCSHSTYAYIPDLAYSKILIYNFERNAAYSMSHNFFHMNPHECEFDIDNLKFSWDDGIFSIALSPPDDTADGHRTAYFHPMCRLVEHVFLFLKSLPFFSFNKL